MTTNTNHAFASTNQNGIDSREAPGREAETSSISASLLSIQNIMASSKENRNCNCICYCVACSEGLKWK